MDSFNDSYVTVFMKTAPPQIQRCISHFRRTVFDKYKSRNSSGQPITSSLDPKEYWVAGGSVRDFFQGKDPADVDLFFPDSLERQSFGEIIAEIYGSGPPGNVMVKENKNVLKVNLKKEGVKLDLVKLHYSTVQDLLRSFDFTVCAAAVAPNYIVYHKNFFLDLATKSLVLNSPPTSINILYRLQKYIRKGYFMDNKSLVEIIKTMNRLNISQEELDKCMVEDEWEYKKLTDIQIPF